jgi:putative resolvase
MRIYKTTEASEYLGVSINTLKTLANNGKIKSFKTTGEHRRFRQDGLDSYMGVEKEKQEKLSVIYARCSTAKQKENLERQKDRLRKHAEAKGYKYMMIDEIARFKNAEEVEHFVSVLDSVAEQMLETQSS